MYRVLTKTHARVQDIKESGSGGKLNPVASPLSCPICSPMMSADDSDFLYYPSDEEIPVSLCKHLYGYPRDLSAQYDIKEALGKGSFGVVHRAISRETGESFAVKTLAKSRPTWTGGMDGGMREATNSTYLLKIQAEVNFNARLSDLEEAVRLTKAFEDDTHVHLVMDLCTGGSLFDRMKGGKALPENQAKTVIRTVMFMLMNCHARGIIYRDIKPQNFLYVDKSPNSKVKCSDFGLAISFIPGDKALSLSKRAGTPVYMAPEVVLRRYNESVDCWSAGILMYQMLVGKFPLWGGDAPLTPKLDDIFFSTLLQQIDFDVVRRKASADAADLCQKLLIRDPEYRISAAAATKHPWLK